MHCRNHCCQAALVLQVWKRHSRGSWQSSWPIHFFVHMHEQSGRQHQSWAGARLEARILILHHWELMRWNPLLPQCSLCTCCMTTAGRSMMPKQMALLLFCAFHQWNVACLKCCVNVVLPCSSMALGNCCINNCFTDDVLHDWSAVTNKPYMHVCCGPFADFFYLCICWHSATPISTCFIVHHSGSSYSELDSTFEFVSMHVDNFLTISLRPACLSCSFSGERLQLSQMG